MADILYGAVYPAAQSAPTASQIIDQTVANAVFQTGAASEGTIDITFTGLTGETEYRAAFVFSDGVEPSNVAVSDQFTTLKEVDVDAGVDSIVVSGALAEIAGMVVAGPVIMDAAHDTIVVTGLAGSTTVLPAFRLFKVPPERRLFKVERF